MSTKRSPVAIGLEQQGKKKPKLEQIFPQGETYTYGEVTSCTPPWGEVTPCTLELFDNLRVLMGLCLYRRPQPGEAVNFKERESSAKIDFESVNGVSATCTSPPSEPLSIGIVNHYEFTLKFMPNGCICVQEHTECKGEFQGTVGQVIKSGLEIRYVVDQKVVHVAKDLIYFTHGRENWRIFKDADACDELDLRWVGNNNNQKAARTTLFGSFNFEILNRDKRNKETLRALELFASALPRNCFEYQRGDFSPSGSAVSTIMHPDLAGGTTLKEVFQTHFFVSPFQSKPILFKQGLNPWAKIGDLSLNPSWDDVQRLVTKWLTSGQPGQFDVDIQECILKMKSRY